MIFNHSIKMGLVKINGTTRFHKYKYSRCDGVTGYEVGVNIIPKRFGVLFYIWITNERKRLEYQLRGKDEYIEILKEMITMLSPWRN